MSKSTEDMKHLEVINSTNMDSSVNDFIAMIYTDERLSDSAYGAINEIISKGEVE
jgi:hypothetical protein